MAFAIDDLSSVIAHWSADAITGLSDGDPVDTLPDSISSWDLTATTTARPLYRATSSINSLPAVEFDGSNDFEITATTKAIGGNICSVSVVSIDVIKNYNTVLSLSTINGLPVYSAVSHGLMAYFYATGQQLVSTYDSGVKYAYGPSGVMATGVVMITLIITDSYYVIRLNGRGGIGSATGNSNAQCVGVPSQNYYASFGANSTAGAYFDGLLAETVLCYETILFESRYIEGVLAHKYGITLPTSHPFYAAAPTTGPGAGGGSTLHPLYATGRK